MIRPLVILVNLFFSVCLFANPIEIIGEKSTYINTSSTNKASAAVPKQVRLMQIKLSPAAQKIVAERLKYAILYPTSSAPYKAAVTKSVASKIDLGMNGVRVLDQGANGSCVTFAVTGAIDSYIIKQNGKDDYISQLCNLTLGVYLFKNGQGRYTGWNGSFGEEVIKQIKKHGFLSTDHEGTNGCAGLFDYVERYTSPSHYQYVTTREFNAGTFASISEYLTDYRIETKTLSTVNDYFSRNFNGLNLLNNVKAELKKGNRVVFGALLNSGVGPAGAIGSYVKPYDTWAVNPLLLLLAKYQIMDSGHEMIIVGYDDKAVVKMKYGNKVVTNTGILYLRNSWGANAGNKGIYYMTYDYFKILCMEAYSIYKI